MLIAAELGTSELPGTILDSLSDSFFAVDHEWRFTYVNPAAVPLLRHYSGELYERTLWEILPEMVGTQLESQFRRAFREHVPVAFETFYRPFETWFMVRAYPTLDGGLAVYLQDVTDRKQAELDRQRLAAIVTSSHDAIVGVTLDGTVTDWNPGAERLYRYTAEEVLGRPMSVLFPGDGQARLMAMLAEAGAGGHTVQVELPAVTRDGGHVEVSLTVSPLRGEFGHIVGAATIARDLTEQKAAQKQLRLLAAALQAAANAIVITDASGQILWVNPAFTRLTGYTLDEARGHNPRMLKSGHHDQGFYARLWQTILSGEVFRGNMLNRRKDGVLYEEHMTITPVRDTAGEVSHFIAVKEDVLPAEHVVRATDEAAASLQPA
jgi:PAS domain S-box-containing protein